MPLVPPVTFSARFSCSFPLSDPMEETGTFDFLTENPPLDRNSQVGGSFSLRAYIWER